LFIFSPTKLYDAVTVGIVTGIMMSMIRSTLNMMFLRSSNCLFPPMNHESRMVFPPPSCRFQRLLP